MSRPTWKNGWKKTRRTNTSSYKCRCEWCINLKFKNRKGLTIKEDLSL